jgi:hypothetical protein
MKISSSPHGLDVGDLPAGLSGVYGSDVVLPTGESVYLRGASRDANVHLQHEIGLVANSVPVSMSPQLLLKTAVGQFSRRLMETAQSAI